MRVVRTVAQGLLIDHVSRVLDAKPRYSDQRTGFRSFRWVGLETRPSKELVRDLKRFKRVAVKRYKGTMGFSLKVTIKDNFKTSPRLFEMISSQVE